MRTLEIGRMGMCVMLAASLCLATACGGSGGGGVFTPGADNDASCPETAADFENSATIPADSDCSYTNLVSGGNIIVEDGASLTLDGAEVSGNIQAESAGAVVLRDSTVGGNLHVTDAPSAELSGIVIEGDLQIRGVSGAVMVTDAVITGDLQILDCGEAAELDSVTVGGNLDCSGNEADPSIADVSVDGEATGQCAP